MISISCVFVPSDIIQRLYVCFSPNLCWGFEFHLFQFFCSPLLARWTVVVCRRSVFFLNYFCSRFSRNWMSLVELHFCCPWFCHPRPLSHTSRWSSRARFSKDGVHWPHMAGIHSGQYGWNPSVCPAFTPWMTTTGITSSIPATAERRGRRASNTRRRCVFSPSSFLYSFYSLFFFSSSFHFVVCLSIRLLVSTVFLPSTPLSFSRRKITISAFQPVFTVASAKARVP